MSATKPMGDIPVPATQWNLIERKDYAEISPLKARIPKARLAHEFREKAFRVVREWEELAGLVECVVPGRPAVWWGALRNQFILQLADVLPIIEGLRLCRRDFKEGPAQVLIDAPLFSAPTYAAAFSVCFPRTRIFVKNRWSEKMKIWAFRQVRSWRMRSGLARLKKMPPRTKRPRILLLGTETHGIGRRDKDLWPIEQALGAKGIEVVHMVSGCTSALKNLTGLLTRPGNHIFTDMVALPLTKERREFLPINPNRFQCDGLDFFPMVQRLRVSAASFDTAVLDHQWTELIKRIEPDYILTGYGHCELGAFSRAAIPAGVKYCLLQHGRITPTHAMYIFPKCAAKDYPLPHKMIVYSKAEAKTLAAHSVFEADSIVVAGSPEWDSILEKSLRAENLPGPVDGRPRRWLFTSQPDLDEKIMALLIQGVVGLSDELRIRLHPREKTAESWQRLLAGFKLKAEIVNETFLEDDLMWCDVHLTYTSTCVLHAVIADRPSILLGAIDDSWRDNFIAAGVGRKAVNAEELAEAVTEFTGPPGRAEFAAKREKFLREQEIELIPSGTRIANLLYPSIGRN